LGIDPQTWEGRVMRAVLPVIAVGWVCLLGAAAQAGDHEDIQGAWDMEGMAVTRRPDAPNYQRGVRLTARVTFTGDQVEIRGTGKFGAKDLKTFFPAEVVRGTFRLNPGTDPKGITITRVTFSKGLVREQVTHLGIYQFQDGKLRLILSAPGRPAPAGFIHQKGAEYLWLSGKRTRTP
jgi:uncharacterized protein (TIGR03067 family)